MSRKASHENQIKRLLIDQIARLPDEAPPHRKAHHEVVDLGRRDEQHLEVLLAAGYGREALAAHDARGGKDAAFAGAYPVKCDLPARAGEFVNAGATAQYQCQVGAVLAQVADRVPGTQLHGHTGVKDLVDQALIPKGRVGLLQPLPLSGLAHAGMCLR